MSCVYELEARLAHREVDHVLFGDWWDTIFWLYVVCLIYILTCFARFAEFSIPQFTVYYLRSAALLNPLTCFSTHVSGLDSCPIYLLHTSSAAQVGN